MIVGLRLAAAIAVAAVAAGATRAQDNSTFTHNDEPAFTFRYPADWAPRKPASPRVLAHVVSPGAGRVFCTVGHVASAKPLAGPELARARQAFLDRVTADYVKARYRAELAAEILGVADDRLSGVPARRIDVTYAPAPRQRARLWQWITLLDVGEIILTCVAPEDAAATGPVQRAVALVHSSFALR
jgi:hypothetical protein